MSQQKVKGTENIIIDNNQANKVMIIHKKSPGCYLISAQSILGIDCKFELPGLRIEVAETLIGPQPKIITVFGRKNGFDH